MQDFSMQELISSANERINNKKKKELEKEQDEARQKKSRTEKLAISIQKMILGILKNCKNHSGYISNLGEIEKYGTPKMTEWTLDDSNLRIKLDFSYTIYHDVLCYSGPRGFRTFLIDWEYLCKLLKNNNIIIDHYEKRTVKESKDSYGSTTFTDIITITVGQAKSKSANDEDTSESENLSNNNGEVTCYKTCDGKDVATMDEVMAYNQNYYYNMMNNSNGSGGKRL